ncbi:MAG: Flp pilus assembly complex ATPase component TadA [Lentisphaeria bacterium]|nr:Flp pilus assembly complex ATPase component TadA [Lentisphaeria bacterium]
MYLIVKQKNRVIHTLNVDEVEVLLIGRDPSCQIVLPDSMASRLHAKLSRKDGKFLLTDCDSRHGIFINGKRIAGELAVTPDDDIRICSCNLRLLDDQGEVMSDPSVAEECLLTTDEFDSYSVLYSGDVMELKKKIHELVLRDMNLASIRAEDLGRQGFQNQLERSLQKVLREFWHEIPPEISPESFQEALRDDLIFYGPISPLMRLDDINEIMVNGADRVCVEKNGVIYRTGIRFFNEAHLISIIQRIVEKVGRHIDEVSPMVDARMPDGSRVNAVIPPLALDGAALTIRKFAKERLTTSELIQYGSLSGDMAVFLQKMIRLRKSILISGGTGTGKTTLLNVLSNFIPVNERIVTIEDSAELRLNHWNLVWLESRLPNVEGRGRVSIRDLVINSLRMRPDRIIVGECRGGEAWDMLQAMNTGHEGSLCTIHANSPRDALSRLENMVLMAGFELPVNAIRDQIVSSIDLIVHLSRLSDGSRKITQISEVVGREGTVVTMQDIFTFQQTGVGPNGKVIGRYCPTGNIPACLVDLRNRGLDHFDFSVFSKNDKQQ